MVVVVVVVVVAHRLLKNDAHVQQHVGQIKEDINRKKGRACVLTT